jgi:hypothetical protein
MSDQPLLEILVTALVVFVTALIAEPIVLGL